jgi:hypothetical protein
MPWLSALMIFLAIASATILQNGQVREDPYPGQATLLTSTQLSSGWKVYNNHASVLRTAYKGRWDDQYSMSKAIRARSHVAFLTAISVSWWSAPGMKLVFTGPNLAIEFGKWTSDGVLLAWRTHLKHFPCIRDMLTCIKGLDGLDWNFANVSANSTYQFVNASTPGQNLNPAGQSQTFEFRYEHIIATLLLLLIWTQS